MTTSDRRMCRLALLIGAWAGCLFAGLLLLGVS